MVTRSEAGGGGRRRRGRTEGSSGGGGGEKVGVVHGCVGLGCWAGQSPFATFLTLPPKSKDRSKRNGRSEVLQFWEFPPFTICAPILLTVFLPTDGRLSIQASKPPSATPPENRTTNHDDPHHLLAPRRHVLRAGTSVPCLERGNDEIIGPYFSLAAGRRRGLGWRLGMSVGGFLRWGGWMAERRWVGGAWVVSAAICTCGIFDSGGSISR